MRGPRKVRAVPALILFTTLIFIYQLTLNGWQEDRLIRMFGLSVAGLESGRWWEFVTHAFLHGNLIHFLCNMLALWFIGRLVEPVLGAFNFVLLYLVSAIGGGVAQVLLGASGASLIGASGAVCGVLLAFTTMYANTEVIALIFFIIPVRLKAKYLGYGLIVLTLIAMAFHFEMWIGHAAHLGGAITGYLFIRFSGLGQKSWLERLLIRA